MIKVKVEENNNYISKVTIKGHANYDELGKDIVCAAVSSIVITTVNAIEKLDKTFINHNLSKDVLTINIVKNSDVVKALDGLPPVKIHCSVLAEEAIHKAINDYRKNAGLSTEGWEFEETDHDELHDAVHGHE